MKLTFQKTALKRYQYCSQGSSIKNNDAYFLECILIALLLMRSS